MQLISRQSVTCHANRKDVSTLTMDGRLSTVSYTVKPRTRNAIPTLSKWWYKIGEYNVDESLIFIKHEHHTSTAGLYQTFCWQIFASRWRIQLKLTYTFMVTSGVITGRGGKWAKEWLSKNCQKIFFLSENYCPKMQNLWQKKQHFGKI